MITAGCYHGSLQPLSSQFRVPLTFPSSSAAKHVFLFFCQKKFVLVNTLFVTMAPTPKDSIMTQGNMKQVVGVLGGAYYGPYVAKKEVDDPEVQIYWKECAEEVSRVLGKTFSADDVKKIWSECKKMALLLKDFLPSIVDEEYANEGNFGISREALTLMDDLPEEFQLTLAEQLKKEKLRSDLQAVQIAQLQAANMQLREELRRVKVATGNETVVVVSDDSCVEEYASSMIDETNDTSTNASPETSGTSLDSSKSD